MGAIPHTGELTARVTIQAPSVAADAAGQEKPSFTELAAAWGRFETLTGTEGPADGTIEAVATSRLTIRYNATLSTIDERHRVVFGSRTFGIVTVHNHNESNEWLILDCREVKT